MKVRFLASGLALGLASILVGCGEVGGPGDSSVETGSLEPATVVTAKADANDAEGTTEAPSEETTVSDSAEPVTRSDEEWKALLTPEEYHVLREKGTERPFVNKYDHHFEPGTYVCAGCGAELFESDTKFDSGCGWPAFYASKAGDRVTLTKDYTFGMVRTEVTCARCDGHLGHIFDDAPQTPTGQRYCINSVSIKFVPKEADAKASSEDADAR